MHICVHPGFVARYLLSGFASDSHFPEIVHGEIVHPEIVHGEIVHGEIVHPEIVHCEIVHGEIVHVDHFSCEELSSDIHTIEQPFSSHACSLPWSIRMSLARAWGASFSHAHAFLSSWRRPCCT